MSIAAPRLDPAASTGADLEMSLAGDLASFFDVSLDLLCIRDMALNFTRVNRTWETVLGYSAADLEGAALLPLVHPDDVAATQGHMERMVTEDQVLGFINRYRHKDGGYRHLEWRARRVGDKVYGVARDVTERLAAEAAIKAAQEAAETASQAKSDFLANISHEIRTPLNGVIGLTAALKQTDLTPAQHEIVRMIESSGVTLERLVSDILDVSRIEAGQVELEALVFNLRHEIDGLLETHRLRAEAKGLDFRVEHDGDDAAFVGDITRIKQVLGNLLSNAVKFTEQGVIELRVEVAAADDQRLQVVIEVQDQGPGISEDTMARLFTPYAQASQETARTYGGTGLGLAVSRQLARLMGGELEARPGLSGGAIFRLALSFAVGQEAARASAPALGGAGPAISTLKILAVDDHEVNRRTLALVLEPLGVALSTATDGVAALRRLEAERFDIVLMDVNMPGLDGCEATRRLRAGAGLNRDTPVIGFSAGVAAEEVQACRDAGMTDWVAKPLDIRALYDALDRAVA